MQISTMLKLFSGAGEAFLGIPIYGGLFVITMGWTPLVAMLVLHTINLCFSIKEKQNKYPSIMGIITSLLAYIPFLGMMLHIITAFLLFWDVYQTQKNKALTE